MQTRCPQCQTVTPLEADRPKDASGLFDCPSCGAKFDAYAHLTDAPPADPDSSAATEPPPHRDQGELFVRPRQARPDATPVPRFARQRVRVARPSQWRWWLVGFVLLALLLAIVPIADRNELAGNADWRPRLQSLCHVAGCDLPPWSEPSRFEITARDINRHPSAKQAWLITVSFRNNAAFDQAWPMLELTAADLNGRVVGRRRFSAREYLGGKPESALIAPGQSASATLEVVDPQGDTPSWDIEFR